MLVGGFSLTRIESGFEELGVFAEARYSIGFLLTLAMLGPIAIRRPPVVGRSVWAWIGLVVSLHALVATSTLWSQELPAGSGPILDIALLVVVLLLAVFIFGRSPESGIHVLLKGAVVASVVLMTVGIVVSGQIVGELTQFGAGGIGVARLYGLAIIAAIYLWQKGESKFWVAAVPVCLTGAMLSGSRAAVLGVILTTCLLVPVVVRSSKRAAAMLFIVIAVASTVIFTTTTGMEASELFWSTMWLGDRSDSPGLDALYFADRDRFLSESWELFKEYPVWGAGYGSFAQVSDVAYPHNLLLSITVDTGMVGLLLFGAIAMLLVRRWFRVRSLQHTFAAMAGFFYFICSMFAGSYYDARLMWLFLLLYILPTSPGPNTLPPSRPVVARRVMPPHGRAGLAVEHAALGLSRRSPERGPGPRPAGPSDAQTVEADRPTTGASAASLFSLGLYQCHRPGRVGSVLGHALDR